MDCQPVMDVFLLRWAPVRPSEQEKWMKKVDGWHFLASVEITESQDTFFF